MRIKSLLIALVAFCAGAGTLLLYEIYSFQHIEIRNAAHLDDANYTSAKQEMAHDNPDFVKIFAGKISAIRIDGVSRNCYFFYKKSGIIYEDVDIMYCFDKQSGTSLGRQ